MMHFDSRRSQACEDLYGEKSSYPLESRPIGKVVRQVYFAGRTRRHGERRRYHPHQPEVVALPPASSYEPPEIVPFIDTFPEPEQQHEQEPFPEQKLFLERRMDALETIAGAVILEAQQQADDAACRDII